MSIVWKEYRVSQILVLIKNFEFSYVAHKFCYYVTSLTSQIRFLTLEVFQLLF